MYKVTKYILITIRSYLGWGGGCEVSTITLAEISSFGVEFSTVGLFKHVGTVAMSFASAVYEQSAWINFCKHNLILSNTNSLFQSKDYVALLP